MFHRHTWEIVSQKEQPAPSELSPIKSFSMDGILAYELLRTWNVRPVIVTYRCECGAEKVERV